MKGCSVDLKAMLTGESIVDGVTHSAELLRFVDAVLAEPDATSTGTTDKASAALAPQEPAAQEPAAQEPAAQEPATQELANARHALRQVLSDAAFVDTCATVASFNAVVVVADGTGIPLEQQKAEKTEQMREDLRIDNLRDHGRFDG
jgi:hypothetical protein